MRCLWTFLWRWVFSSSGLGMGPCAIRWPKYSHQSRLKLTGDPQEKQALVWFAVVSTSRVLHCLPSLWAEVLGTALPLLPRRAACSRCFSFLRRGRSYDVFAAAIQHPAAIAAFFSTLCNFSKIAYLQSQCCHHMWAIICGQFGKGRRKHFANSSGICCVGETVV